MAVRREDLDALPRLGWVDAPTPVTPLPELARELGLDWLGVKRDDLCPEVHGGTKVRKLDYVLADARFAEAAEWASVGAIGSGHLATLTGAARTEGRRLLALTFWQPLGEWVEENLAFTASGPTELRYFSSRLSLALRHPGSLVGRRIGGRPVVVPGASSPQGTIGMVRAGIELAEQIRAGVLPAVDRIYVPLGTGGTVVGISLGLTLAGLRPRVHAVSAVELLLARADRLRALTRRTLAAMHELGVRLPDDVSPGPIRIDRYRVGPGYGHATAASLRERESLAALGVELEPIYGGKAMAALRADAPEARGERVLFWHTAHRGGLPHADDWKTRLPPALRSRLQATNAGRLGRRKWIALGAATAAGAALGARVGFHDSVAGWVGHVLYEWEGAVLAAAAEALLPEDPGGPIIGGVSAHEVAVNVDRYLRGAPERMRREVHGLFALVEHGTVLGANLRRFTRLDPPARSAFIRALMERGGAAGQAAKGLRDFVYLGYYQDPRSWSALDYRGPWVRDRMYERGAYDSLIAPTGTAPPDRAT